MKPEPAPGVKTRPIYSCANAAKKGGLSLFNEFLGWSLLHPLVPSLGSQHPEQDGKGQQPQVRSGWDQLHFPWDSTDPLHWDPRERPVDSRREHACSACSMQGARLKPLIPSALHSHSCGKPQALTRILGSICRMPLTLPSTLPSHSCWMSDVLPEGTGVEILLFTPVQQQPIVAVFPDCAVPEELGGQVPWCTSTSIIPMARGRWQP